MRGNNVMLGYYRDPVATRYGVRRRMVPLGRCRRFMHPDGYVELRDRLKDIVISGGENIATIEVEQALMAHEAVSEAAVVGPARREVGGGADRVRDRSTARSRSTASSGRRSSCASRLARFKVPKVIEVMDELPKTATGKIQKFVLRGRAGTPQPDSRVGVNVR